MKVGLGQEMVAPEKNFGGGCKRSRDFWRGPKAHYSNAIYIFISQERGGEGVSFYQGHGPTWLPLGDAPGSSRKVIRFAVGK